MLNAIRISVNKCLEFWKNLGSGSPFPDFHRNFFKRKLKISPKKHAQEPKSRPKCLKNINIYLYIELDTTWDVLTPCQVVLS
jgi:hypothetical protein